MDWTRKIDGYCERTDFAYWSEPVNALTNAAFLVAALVMWRRTAGQPFARALCAILFAIGVGSWLFHTHATAWASLADTAPIGLFILVYLYGANRRFLGWPVWASLMGTAAFVPWAALLTPFFAALPVFAISSFYWPVPTLIALYALVLRRRAPATARGLAAGALLLVASLVFRSLDMPVCRHLAFGTHFAWHLLNALMLGWMIEVWRRHGPDASLEEAPAGR